MNHRTQRFPGTALSAGMQKMCVHVMTSIWPAGHPDVTELQRQSFYGHSKCDKYMILAVGPPSPSSVSIWYSLLPFCESKVDWNCWMVRSFWKSVCFAPVCLTCKTVTSKKEQGKEEKEKLNKKRNKEKEKKKKGN